MLLILLCSAAVAMSPHCFALSERNFSSQLQISNSSMSHFSCQTVKKCPTWFLFNSTTCSCQCLPYDPLKLICDGNSASAYIKIGFIVTYNCDEKGPLISISHWQHYQHLTGHVYNLTKSGHILLPSDIAALNDYMCAPLHRSGFLCSKCKDSFGPSMAMMGHANLKQCYKCREAWIGVILYLLLEFVPITVLFTIFLVFRISVTSAPMTCFVMYSQMIILACYKFWPDCSMSDAVFTETGTLRTVSKIFLTLYGFLNSEFFVHIVPPFCINRHLQLIHVALLGYISAFYPMLLVILTRLCIDLHDRNCQIIVYAWKPFHLCFVRLRRSWEIKNDITDTFASLFLLSFSKILYQANLLLSTHLIFYRSLTQYQSWPQYVLGSDPNIEMGSVIFYTIYGAVGLISIIFSFLPVIILSLYPFRVFRRLLSKLRLDCIGLSIFVEKFHYCYRDGLDQGKDMRIFSGFYFLVRILVVLIPQLLFTTLGLEIWLVRGTTFLFAALLIALCRPYKRTYMNVSDTFLLSHLALLCHIVSSNTKGVRIRVLLQIIILMPFSIFLLFLIIRVTVLFQLCTARFQRCFFHLKACLKSNVGACAKQEGLNQPVANYGAIDG